MVLLELVAHMTRIAVKLLLEMLLIVLPLMLQVVMVELELVAVKNRPVMMEYIFIME